MKFGWFSLSGALLVCLMLVPNVIYGAKHRHWVNKPERRGMNLLEQIGRYGAMLLMVVPLGTSTGELGFSSNASFVLWMGLCAALLAGYFVCWLLYAQRPTRHKALMLAILPSLLFVVRGVSLRHWLLCVFGVVFGVGHLYLTHRSNP